jgi:glycosyltransferase involved in cell wall biosynthesis
MRILHTESSNGWGGQEMRILRESEGMRSRGHEVVFAVARGGSLASHARKAGFVVYEVPLKKSQFFPALFQLISIIRKHRIDIVNTHSSSDAWLGGIAARLTGRKVIRTRHLSTSICKGINSLLLYRLLADEVVTTSSAIVPLIQKQALLPPSKVRCIPTGIDPAQLTYDPEEAAHFRRALGLREDDLLVGTVCVVRSWKGIIDFLRAAELLKSNKKIKWVIVGGGHLHDYLPKVTQWGLHGQVTFTGHLDSPYAAMAAMDIFLLLSTANEGISQATLQASYLKRPMITTSIGGLPEVCLDGKTGTVIPPFSPDKVAEAVLSLAADSELRRSYGEQAQAHVLQKFTLQHTLDQMEQVYEHIARTSPEKHSSGR